MKKTYVKVLLKIDENGQKTPLRVDFYDQKYPIDRILQVRQAAATKAGGQGNRYTIRIGENETYLFEDENARWFVEEKA